MVYLDTFFQPYMKEILYRVISVMSVDDSPGSTVGLCYSLSCPVLCYKDNRRVVTSHKKEPFHFLTLISA